MIFSTYFGEKESLQPPPPYAGINNIGTDNRNICSGRVFIYYWTIASVRIELLYNIYLLVFIIILYEYKRMEGFWGGGGAVYYNIKYSNFNLSKQYRLIANSRSFAIFPGFAHTEFQVSDSGCIHCDDEPFHQRTNPLRARNTVGKDTKVPCLSRRHF